jgi:hypothetical protein
MRLAIAAAACILLAACGPPRTARTPEPPEQVAAAWKRTALERPPLDSAPEALRPAAPLEWIRASYQSYASVVLVDIFRMRSSATAFEMLQRWKSEPGSVAFQHGDLFVVCSSSMESTQGLIEFSAKLEAEWLGTGRKAGLPARRSASMKARSCSCSPAPGAPWQARAHSPVTRRI